MPVGQPVAQLGAARPGPAALISPRVHGLHERVRPAERRVDRRHLHAGAKRGQVVVVRAERDPLDARPALLPGDQTCSRVRRLGGKIDPEGFHMAGRGAGCGPYLFSPGVPAMARRTIRMIPPTNGTRLTTSHQPDLFVSCRWRISTPRDGSRVARPYTIARSSPTAYPNSAIPTAQITRLTIRLMSANHQNSGRSARPPKSV